MGFGDFLKKAEREMKRAGKAIEKETRRSAKVVELSKARHTVEGQFRTMRDFVNLYKRTAKARALIGAERHATLAVSLTDPTVVIPFENITILEEEEIGRGAQGHVYKGFYLNETIAVKVTSNKKEAAELVSLKQLLHPNVVRFIGLSIISRTHYIVMEYCAQGTLYQLLRKRSIGKETFFSFAKQISEGMDFIHSRNIVHRDLKTPNILVDAADVLKICDFGHHRAEVFTGTIMSKKGTYHWMAPEVLKLERASKTIINTILSDEGSVSENLANQIRLRLSPLIPACTLKEIANILESCWQIDPSLRPDFGRLLETMATIQEDCVKYSNALFECIQREGRTNCERRADTMTTDNLSTEEDYGSELYYSASEDSEGS
ncbi:hypothetical protein QR680_006241 [Steinernema hermaphroditum]|uniref:Protein kinase domain-containing protein n=1 Tax=Steinernema hermaphroditum TaxID=289476 RepID=A0AA39LX29_9BILA|nr:hypothetical protein QR680_006241 [Steinernema hermaphroditum]